MTYIKDALSILFKSREKQMIALLLIVIGVFTVRMFIGDKIDVVEEEIHVDEIEAVKDRKDIETNKKQIDALWINLRRMENHHKDHINKKRH